MAQRKGVGQITARKDGSWLVRVSIGRDPVTGRRMRRSKVVHGPRREAEGELVAMEARAGMLPELAGSITVGDYVSDVWLPWCARRLRSDTVAGYRQVMRHDVLPAIGACRLIDLKPAEVDAMLCGIEAQGQRKKAYVTLRTALRRAVRLRMVPYAATDAVECPKPAHYEPTLLPAADVRRFLGAFRGTAAEPAVLIAIGCGLRRSEICGLDWEDVNLAAREVRVSKRYLVIDGRPDMSEPKTERSRRVVSLPASTAARMAEIRPALVGPGPHPLLVGAHGERMPPDSLSQAYVRVRDANDLPKISLKNLRHTHATMLIESGVDVVAVSRRLGHASVSTTDAFYLRPRRAADQAAADAIDRLL